MNTLVLTVCGCTFVLECGEASIAELCAVVFSGLVTRDAPPASGACRCRVRRVPGSEAFEIDVDGVSTTVDDADDLLFFLDKSLTIAVQHARPDLFFLHAGTVAVRGGAIVLPGASGVGKSTLTLALVADGFEYLSDELAPIDLRSLAVEPYPHALCLKHRPAAPHVASRWARQVGRRLHVPVEGLRTRRCRTAVPVRAIVFPHRDPRVRPKRRRVPRLEPISAASAVTRLLAHSLNPLAHPGDGLDAALWLSQSLPCFNLDTSDLPAATAELKARL